jgi:hypothetical protein
MPFYVAARAPSTAGEDAQADRSRGSGGSERPGPAVRVRRRGTRVRLEIERDPSGVVIGAVARQLGSAEDECVGLPLR